MTTAAISQRSSTGSPAAAEHGPAGIDPADIALLTLTYGDRIHMLSRSLESAAQQGLGHVFVLANGLRRGPRARLDVLADRLRQTYGLDVQLFDMPRNLGSSRGIGHLIEAARARPEIAAIWFLDDDNLAQGDCLLRLCSAHAAHPGAALSAVRTDRAYLVHAARTGVSNPPWRGEAFGIHLLKPVRRAVAKIARLLGPRQASAAVPPAVAAPRVPYGGLLVPRALFDTVAPPRADFVIYADDYEYSARLADAGGLFLVGAAEVGDQERSWNATELGIESPAGRPMNQTSRLALMIPDFRLYYSVRNTLYLDHARLRLRDKPAFAVNLMILLALSCGKALLTGRARNARVIYDAARDGIAGRLGENDAYSLP